MRLLRGRAADAEADRAVTRRMVDRTADTGEAALRVWRPHRQVAFGRRDAIASGYQRAREIAAAHAFPPVERDVGGRAVAYPGTAIAVAHAVPVDDLRVGIGDRYAEMSETLQRALWRLGAPVQRGEPPDAFCPGAHSLSWQGKVAGLAQHVKRGVALVGAVVLVREHDAVGAVLEPVYEALGLRLDPKSVGSLDRAGGRDDPDAVRDAIESAFVDGRPAEVESIE